MALHHYVRRLRTQGSPIIPGAITREILSQKIELMEAAAPKTADASSKAFTLSFTKDAKWKTFRESFLNYLDGVRGAKNIPLFYVVRPELRPTNADPRDPIYTTDLFGPQYEQDNRTVFNILEKCMRGGPGEK